MEGPRPALSTKLNSEEFDNWYWSKEELEAFCRILDISATARKNELRRRIIQFLNGEEVIIAKGIISSKFDWTKADLRLDTVITDSVKFGQNFRRFMKEQVGDKFSFSNAFMTWVRENEGKTLEDAIDFWYSLQVKVKNGYKMDMSDFNVMNKYLDDFLADNPSRKREEGMICWSIKKYYPARQGLVKYEQSDLSLARLTE